MKLQDGQPFPSRLRVLLLEDSPRDAKLTAATLGRCGCALQLEVAATPELFQEHLAKADFDIVVADYNLSCWNAMDALATIRESGKDIPLIVLTGVLGDEAAVECIKQGAEDFVLKDRPARLPAAVQRALENKRLRDERKRAEREVRRLNEDLEGRVAALEEVSRRLATLIEINLDLAAERRPDRLLELLCHRARGLIGAGYVVAGALSEDGQATTHLCWSSRNCKAVFAAGRSDSPRHKNGLLSQLLADRRPQRLRNVSANRLATPDPLGREEVPSVLMVPIGTPDRLYGWLQLTDKTGADEFTPEDERLVAALAGQAGIELENHRRNVQVQRYIGELEEQIEERKRAEAELEQSRQEQIRLRDEFLSHVSHELRSPLASIHQFATILLDGLLGELNVEQRGAMEVLVRNSRQLGAMVGDLLTITRSGTGKLTVEPQYTIVSSPSGSIVEALRVLKSKAGAASLCLQTEFSPDLPPVWVDPERTCQILTNLVENAIKFTPEGGRITVSFRRFDEDPNFVLATVADTGRGISPENCRLIFERLFQVESGDDSRKGLGLGLYIAHDLVKRHGGRIWVESDLGRGASFFFTLPVFSLAPLLAPVVTERNLAEKCLWLLAVTLPGEQDGALAPGEREALRRLRGVLGRLVRPETDVLLPVMSAAQARSVHVLACADLAGMRALTHRVREQLISQENQLQLGEPSPAVSFTALEMSRVSAGARPEETLQEVSDCIERLLGNQVEMEVYS